MSKSTLFFGEGVVTSIDHAYIDHEGDIVGGSIAPAFSVSGDIEQHEQVVVDFSKCKKLIKHIIDDKEIGFDHKLVIGEFSNISEIEDTSHGVKIKTPKWDIECPRNAIHLCDVNMSHELYESDIEFYIGSFVEKHMKQHYPNIQVSSYGVGYPQLMPWQKHAAKFRYTHGLKNSSSWGCQNIAHGHLSYVTIDAMDQIGAQVVASQIAAYYDKTMFVMHDNVVSHVPDIFGYTTERGRFMLSPTTATNKIMFFDTETTIENLVTHIAKTFEKQLYDIGASELYVSEGLQKGATIDVRSM